MQSKIVAAAVVKKGFKNAHLGAVVVQIPNTAHSVRYGFYAKDSCKCTFQPRLKNCPLLDFQRANRDNIS